MLCPLQRKAETVQGKIPDTGIHIESLCAAVFGAKPWHHLGEGPRTAGDVDTVPIYNLALEFISQFQIPGSIEIAIGILPGQVVVHVVANIGDALEAAISIWFHIRQRVRIPQRVQVYRFALGDQPSPEINESLQRAAVFLDDTGRIP